MHPGSAIAEGGHSKTNIICKKAQVQITFKNKIHILTLLIFSVSQ